MLDINVLKHFADSRDVTPVFNHVHFLKPTYQWPILDGRKLEFRFPIKFEENSEKSNLSPEFQVLRADKTYYKSTHSLSFIKVIATLWTYDGFSFLCRRERANIRTPPPSKVSSKVGSAFLKIDSICYKFAAVKAWYSIKRVLTAIILPGPNHENVYLLCVDRVNVEPTGIWNRYFALDLLFELLFVYCAGYFVLQGSFPRTGFIKTIDPEFFMDLSHFRRFSSYLFQMFLTMNDKVPSSGLDLIVCLSERCLSKWRINSNSFHTEMFQLDWQTQ